MVRKLGLVGLRDALYGDRRSLVKEPSNAKYKFTEENLLKRQIKLLSFPQVKSLIKYFESMGDENSYVELKNKRGALITMI